MATPSADTADRRAQIRRAAERVFARHGFHNATAIQIAEEAGIAVGTIYNYFRHKEAILTEIFETETEERLAVIHDILATERPMRDKIHEIVCYHIDRALANRELMRLLLSEELHLGGEEAERCAHRMFKAIPQHCAEILEAAMDRGEIRPMDPHVAANAIVGAERSVLARICLFDDAEAERMRETAADELAAFLWRALCPPDETWEEAP